MTCKCVTCNECDGSGTVWISFSGKYMGKYRCDDLDDMDTCPDCDGEGIVEWCINCREAFEDDESWGEF